VPEPDARGLEGFEQFVVARRAALLRTAYLLTGDHSDAEDLVQTALVKVVPRWRRIADRPEPYVRKVLAHEAVTRWRRRRWREVPTAQAPDPAPASVGTGLDGAAAAREDLRRALATLAPRQGAVVVLRYLEDLTERDGAAALGISVGTVKSQHRDALARLRLSLPGWHPGGVGAQDGTPPRRGACADGPDATVTMTP